MKGARKAHQLATQTSLATQLILKRQNGGLKRESFSSSRARKSKKNVTSSCRHPCRGVFCTPCCHRRCLDHPSQSSRFLLVAIGPSFSTQGIVRSSRSLL
jgi:hypothetical protein